MSSVAIVTDTTHYMPHELVERHGLHTISLYVHWTDPPLDIRESDMPDFDDFYRRLRVARDLPTTSQPSVGDFTDVYRPLLDRGDDIISIHISGGTSGTVRAAEQARDQLAEAGIDPARIEIIDSLTLGAGQGLMAIAAANAIKGGASFAQASARARELRDQLDVRFAVETLEFLRRGGRIGGAQAWIGTSLRIKPILTVKGEITPIERIRTWGRAFEHLVSHLQMLRDAGRDRFVVQHIDNPEQGELLAARGAEIFGRPPEFLSNMGPVIGTHAGPGLLATTAVSSELLGEA